MVSVNRLGGVSLAVALAVMVLPGCGSPAIPPAPTGSVSQQGLEGDGYAETLQRNFGAGSAVDAFTQSLKKSGEWKESPAWSISATPSGQGVFRVDLWEPGDGKVFVEPCLFVESRDKAPEVTVLFMPWDMSVIDKAHAHLTRKLVAVGRAMRLSDAELDRLRVLSARIPLSRTAHQSAAIASFVRDVPPRVQDRFARCAELAAKNYIPVDKDSVIRKTPAIGFRLGSEWAAEVVFGAADDSAWSLGNRGDLGKCWSLKLCDCKHSNFTSDKEPTPGPMGAIVFDWPRLTPEESEAILAKWAGR
jgi:hypothetical protein